MMNPASMRPTPLDETDRFVCRPVEARDNAAVKALVVETLAEFGHTGQNFACSDPELDDMTATYARDGARFWLIEDTQKPGSILGCGGYDRLKGTTPDEGVVEMQKLYFRPALRGLGLGRRLCELILAHAAADGYRQMYIETTPNLAAAVKLYEKLGFDYLQGPMGATGHSGCTVWMGKALVPPA